ncbi:MAG: DinB family protein [Acidobacteriota bacterium]
MSHDIPTEIEQLVEALDAAERDAQALVDGLSEEIGTRRVKAGSWSVAECLDHLELANRLYLEAMQEPAERARQQGRLRRRPAKPGLLGGLFVAQLEPPPRRWMPLKAPPKILPQPSPPLAETAVRFMNTQSNVRNFLLANADLDLYSIRFKNPFIGVIYFSLATGLHVIPAHERRHLLQAWNVRRALEG